MMVLVSFLTFLIPPEQARTKQRTDKGTKAPTNKNVFSGAGKGGHECNDNADCYITRHYLV